LSVPAPPGTRDPPRTQWPMDFLHRFNWNGLAIKAVTF
jgi:hypothetical protein